MTDPALEVRTVGFEGFDFSVSVSGASAPTFGDLFSEIWRQRERTFEPHQPERGADLHLTMALPFEAAARGGQRQVTVTRQERCAVCRGTGTTPSAERECADVSRFGRGQVGARAHGVFAAVRAVPRHRPPARRAVSGVRRTAA